MWWLRVKRYCEWLRYRWVRHDKRDGPPFLVVIDYGPGFERRAVFVNGRLVTMSPEVALTITYD
jgi:hypothetical protein